MSLRDFIPLETQDRGADECLCGHALERHIRLPGHPDGAEECWGTDDCECGQFRAKFPMPAADRGYTPGRFVR